ncbi:MAG TPA: vWA domain-containing protein [Myxococcaceae bacterium]|nr:vWA domain-containing protein [Myxococcaceae bacterium]
MNRSWKVAALGAALMAFPCLAKPATDPKPTATEAAPAPSTDGRPRVQIAILLDTSSSMDGLIAQAKQQLWKIVNTFNTAKRDGKKPILQLALYEYGKDSLPASGGYIRQIVPFTEDLDRVSEHLFALKTNGGDEYCGQVIQKATQQLAWSKNKEDMRFIFIAGNEDFNQGPVNYKTSIAAASEHGIIVNTIHCGSEADGVRGGWKAGAQLAHGNYMFIDQNKAVAEITAPQDQELARLGMELNKTYVGYGRGATEAQKRQADQDSNAAAMAPSAMSQRAVSKASSYYDNSHWDLVDGSKKGTVKVEALPAEQLPEELRKLDAPARKAFVEKKAKEREDIQKRIAELNAERSKFIAAEAQKQSAASAEESVDGAMIKTIKQQASKNAYTF